jgi:putative ABC transport system ATP-binding protein
MNIILSMHQLSKRFTNGSRMITVLDDITLDIPTGTTCAIVGPSGSGKSTLLGLCAGLDAPSSGSIVMNGQTINDLDEDARAELRSQQIGFIFQNFQLIPTLTALENVMVPLEIRGDRHAREYAVEFLRQVGLAERIHHFPVQLSGGEQQRVAIARAFINRPSILFADEPTGNLDADTSETIENLLFELNKAKSTTLVIATHDLELAARCDRTIRLKGGRLMSEHR